MAQAHDMATVSDPSGRAGALPGARRSAAVRRIAIVTADAAGTVRTATPVLDALAAAGHAVRMFAPSTAGAGAADASVPTRAGTLEIFACPQPGPLGWLGRSSAADAMATMLAEWNAHVVVAMGPLTTVMGLQAARQARIERVVPVVARLGDLAVQPAGTRPAWRSDHHVRKAYSAATSAVFHTQALLASARERRLLPPAVETVVLPGFGVDLTDVRPAALPPVASGLSVALIAGDEGTADQSRPAVEQLRAHFRQLRIETSGPGDGRAAIVETIARAHIVVMLGREPAVPESLLLALALGRPLIVPAIDGYREAVDERVNGVIYAAHDMTALVTAVHTMVRRPDLFPAMARASRAKAERRYDAGAVASRLLSLLGLL